MSSHRGLAALAGDSETLIGRETCRSIERAILVRHSPGRAPIVVIRRATLNGASCGEIRLHEDALDLAVDAIASARAGRRGDRGEAAGIAFEVGGGGALGIGLVGRSIGWLSPAAVEVLAEAISIARGTS